MDGVNRSHALCLMKYPEKQISRVELELAEGMPGMGG